MSFLYRKPPSILTPTLIAPRRIKQKTKSPMATPRKKLQSEDLYEIEARRRSKSTIEMESPSRLRQFQPQVALPSSPKQFQKAIKHTVAKIRENLRSVKGPAVATTTHCWEERRDHQLTPSRSRLTPSREQRLSTTPDNKWTTESEFYDESEVKCDATEPRILTANGQLPRPASQNAMWNYKSLQSYRYMYKSQKKQESDLYSSQKKISRLESEWKQQQKKSSMGGGSSRDTSPFALEPSFGDISQVEANYSMKKKHCFRSDNKNKAGAITPVKSINLIKAKNKANLMARFQEVEAMHSRARAKEPRDSSARRQQNDGMNRSKSAQRLSQKMNEISQHRQSDATKKVGHSFKFTTDRSISPPKIKQCRSDNKFKLRQNSSLLKRPGEVEAVIPKAKQVQISLDSKPLIKGYLPTGNKPPLTPGSIKQHSGQMRMSPSAKKHYQTQEAIKKDRRGGGGSKTDRPGPNPFFLLVADPMTEHNTTSRFTDERESSDQCSKDSQEQRIYAAVDNLMKETKARISDIQWDSRPRAPVPHRAHQLPMRSSNNKGLSRQARLQDSKQTVEEPDSEPFQ